MKRTVPICFWCKHFHDKISSELPYIKICTAFPKGIPVEIWGDEYGASFDHRFIYPDDNNIQFEKADNAELLQRSVFKNNTSTKLLDESFEYNANYVRQNHENRLNPPEPIKTMRVNIIPLDSPIAQALRERFDTWDIDLSAEDNNQEIPEEIHLRIQANPEAYIAWLEQFFATAKTRKEALRAFWNVLTSLKEGKYP